MATLTTGANERASIEAFRRDVIEASMTALVILDFWAEWCGPCKQLGPVLDKVAAAYAPRGVKLVKIDVDKNQTIAAQFRVQSIPTVYAIYRGQPVADLTPARTERELSHYLDQILAQLPIEAADGAAADIGPLIEQAFQTLDAGDAARAAAMFAELAEVAPENDELSAGEALALVRLGDLAGADAALARTDPASTQARVVQARAALALAREFGGHSDAQALSERVVANPDDHAARYDLAGALAARGDRDAAATQLLESIRRDRTWNDGAARARLLKLFEATGLDDPWVIKQRRALSAILFA